MVVAVVVRVIVSTTFHTSGPKPQRPPCFKTIGFKLVSLVVRVTRGSGGCTDHLKSIQIHFFLRVLAVRNAWQAEYGCRG